MTRSAVIVALFGLISAGAAHAAPRQAADTPDPAAGSPDKIVCKTFTRIGTLADRYRTCKTKGEWARERNNLRQSSVSDSCGTRGENGGGSTPMPGSPG